MKEAHIILGIILQILSSYLKLMKYTAMCPCKHVLWSDLDSKLKENILSILTVNARSITGKFAELVTILNLVIKHFSFIISTEPWKVLRRKSFTFCHGLHHITFRGTSNFFSCTKYSAVFTCSTHVIIIWKIIP